MSTVRDGSRVPPSQHHTRALDTPRLLPMHDIDSPARRRPSSHRRKSAADIDIDIDTEKTSLPPIRVYIVNACRAVAWGTV
jgi:hypothetical protein